MKALRVNKEEGDARISIEDVDIPTIRPGELLVKIRASFVRYQEGRFDNLLTSH